MENLTERLDKHLQSIKEDSRVSNVDLKKLYAMVPERNSRPIEKAIYNLILKPLEKRIESKKYIYYLEQLNKKPHYMEMIKAFYLEGIDILKDLKNIEKRVYDTYIQKYGPLNKDNVYDWYYDWFIEDNPSPEPSGYWYEGGFDEKFEDLIKNSKPGIHYSVGFTVGECETINLLVELFWNRVDRLEDSEQLQKALLKQLYK